MWAFLLVVVIAAVLAGQAVTGRGSGPVLEAGAPLGSRLGGVEVWMVRPGDTLWSIAEAVDRGGDPRPLVDAMQAELGGTTIYPGERLVLPGGG